MEGERRRMHTGGGDAREAERHGGVGGGGDRASVRVAADDRRVVPTHVVARERRALGHAHGRPAGAVLQAGVVDVGQALELAARIAADRVAVVHPVHQPPVVALLQRAPADCEHSRPVREEDEEPHDVMAAARGRGRVVERAPLDERLVRVPFIQQQHRAQPLRPRTEPATSASIKKSAAVEGKSSQHTPQRHNTKRNAFFGVGGSGR
jgi:hypothetical protein